MPPSPAHTSRVRAEIFGHAGRLFRLRGYAGTNIDDIMLAAGLTRGSFYAHFKSKEDLFVQVIGSGQGLLWKTRAANAEILAFILKANNFPAGPKELSDSSANLKAIRFDAVRPPPPEPVAKPSGKKSRRSP